jgi:hypothetical protein
MSVFNLLWLLYLLGGPSTDPSPETVRYVRPAGDKFATECQFVIKRTDAGWTITSVTERGRAKMKVVSRYDREDRLVSATAVYSQDGLDQAATVEVKDGKATISLKGQEPRRFEVPKGTIVTSAPDWSDIFLLCRRYDRDRKGKQEFPGLWIHPAQPPQRLTFTIEFRGIDSIDHGGKKVALSRFAIRIRNNSAYVAWADGKGRMVRLLPLPQGPSAAGLTQAGFEKSAAGLRPAQ